jgi:triacylglycerol lipase
LDPTVVLSIALEHPIVLAHGLFGFRRIGLGRFTLTSYFRGIPEYLRAGGNRVHVTRVPPIAGVEFRARVLADEIDRVFPNQRIHLIGHSMGGLDARRLLDEPRWARRILSLTTVATPHLGSTLADLARVRVGPIYRLLESLGIDHRGFMDVTRTAARDANAAGASSRSLPVFSVAGVPEESQVCWPLRALHETLRGFEGPNDGLVSRESALGFGTPLQDWPVDHLRQMNWFNPPFGNGSRMSVRLLYASILENLVDQGFGRPGNHEHELPRVGSRSGIQGVRGTMVGGWAGGLVEEDRDGHVAQDVGGRATAIEEPVDREEDRDLVDGDADGGEDEGEGHEAP